MTSSAEATRPRERIARWFILGALGMLPLLRPEPQIRWVVWLVAASLIVVVVTRTDDIQRLLLLAFVFSLQIDARLHLLYHEASSWVGQSGPTSIEVPLVGVVGLALMGSLTLGFGKIRRRAAFPREARFPAAALVVAATLSLLNTPERFYGLCYILHMLIVMLIMVVVANAVTTRRDVELVADVLVVSLVIQSMIYWAESATGMTVSLEGYTFAARDDLPRHGGTVGAHANTFASFIAPLLLITIARFLAGTVHRGRALMPAVIVLGVCTLVGTFTRGAWVGFTIGLVYLLFDGQRRGLIRLRPLLPMGGLFVLAVPFLIRPVMERLGADHQAAYEERRALMQMAMSVIRAHPFIGCGAGAYASVFRQYLPPELSTNWLFVVHNRYLLIAAEMGIVGLIAFLSLLVAGLRLGTALSSSRERDLAAVAAGCTAAFITLAWNMYWESFSNALPVEGMLWFLLGLLCAMRRLGEFGRDRDQGGIIKEARARWLAYRPGNSVVPQSGV